MTLEEQIPSDESSALENSDERVETVIIATDVNEGVPQITFVVPETVVDVIATDDLALDASVDLPNAILSAIDSMKTAIEKRLDSLQSAFNREIRAEATHEKVVDRLHAELQEYKNDLLLNLLRPIFIDLIQLHDDIGKIVGTQFELSESPSKLLDLMRGFQQGIEDILYRQGVEPFEVEDNAFDPRRQRAFSNHGTDDPVLTKTVAARLRKGFRAGEKVIRPEIVSVYTLKRAETKA